MRKWLFLYMNIYLINDTWGFKLKTFPARLESHSEMLGAIHEGKYMVMRLNSLQTRWQFELIEIELANQKTVLVIK